ncbi:PAS domain S-box-containing protein [Halorubrum trapanicum]|uniref:histidine kinase n=1 Tax=Halorubrum trapanicum TaxID=29284 RepID=A0A8J7UQN7_9EURY|nr:PAS domain-containing sensor histidine kinase [Halorubrum trapanicum]MBP1902708.1 PAS domain S-box-containing protein [Halorubrum trapanicum]
MGDRDPDRRARDLRRYETILGSLDDAVYAIRPDGTIVYVNERYAEMKGVDREQLLGTDIYDWVSEETAERARRERAAMREEGRKTGAIEYEFETENGDSFPAEMRFGRTDLDDREELGRVGVIRNVTERKRRERELERQNERLDEFASIVSHDLRNPLDVARGHLDLAREERDSEHLEAVGRAHDRMATLIDDLLTLAREGVDVESLEPVDLSAVAEECWAGVDTADATLRAETTQTVRADRSRLRQLLENLLRNAVSHGGSAVTVTLGDLDDGFYVEDDGPGIPEGERDGVFEAGHTTDPDGTGFGLAIVERVAEAHGWEVAVTASAEGGARFEFTGVDVE